MLRDRIEDFVANRAHPSELHELLCECISDGTVEGLAGVRRLYEDMYGGITYNFELKAAAASCLIFWGEAGLKVLVEGATATPTSKNVSLCVQILSTVASGRPLPRIPFIHDDQILKAVQLAHEKLKDIGEVARVLLTQFILSQRCDSRVASIGGHLSMISEDWAASKELFAAMSSRWLAVGEPVLKELENLIDQHPSKEPMFQNFLTEHPQLLDPMATQVWPQPNLLGSRFPDFLVRRADNSYLVIEIECPAKSLVKGRQVSAAVTHAEQQATDYRDYLMRRHQDAVRNFPHFNDPDCLVVIGLERDLTDKQLATLAHVNRHRVRLRIVGFDWLVDRARNISANVTRHRVQVIKARIE